MDTILFFIFAAIFYRGLGWALGAPFMTPDSEYYLEMAKMPLNYFGGHFPIGFSGSVYLLSLLGLGPAWAVFTLSMVKATFVYLIFRKVYGSRWAFLPSCVFCLLPEMLALDMAAWSESGFIAILIILSYLLMSGRLGKGVIILCVAAFLLMAEFRHASVFFLPGLALALSTKYYLEIKEKIDSTRRLVLRLVGIIGIVTGSWFALNMVRTGHPFKPSKTQFECVHFLAAYSQIPFCREIPNNLLCLADQNRTFLGVADVDPNLFIYGQEGPIKKIADPIKLCQSWAEVKATLIREYPLVTAKLIFKRFLYQFKEWQASERGKGLNPIQSERANHLFDRALEIFKVYWYLIALWMPAVFVTLIWGSASICPMLIFLLMGAVGHAFGIAINNPFLTSRYMFIHKGISLFAGLTCLPCIFGLVKGRVTRRLEARQTK